MHKFARDEPEIGHQASNLDEQTARRPGERVRGDRAAGQEFSPLPVGDSPAKLFLSGLLAARSPAREITTGRPRRRNRRDAILAEAVAESTGHCGEVFQGPFQILGQTVTGLATLLDAKLFARARVRVRRGTGIVLVEADKTKVRAALQALLLKFGHHHVDLIVHIETNIVEGVGQGSSSAEVHAALRAAQKALQIRATDLQIAWFAFMGEGATDPLPMEHWGATVVWASRRGTPIEIIKAPLPPLVCVGVIADAMRAVSTNRQAAETTYLSEEIREFRPIYRSAKKAILCGKSRQVVAAGSASLRLNQHRCPTPRLSELEDIARITGALGVLGSHSGTAAAIAFDGASEGIAGRVQAACDYATSAQFAGVHVFTVGGTL